MGRVPRRLPWQTGDDDGASLKLRYELGGEEYRVTVTPTRPETGRPPWRLHVSVLMRNPDPVTEAQHEFHTGYYMTAAGARQAFRRWLIKRTGEA